jgi:hypothetical protein
MMPKVIAATVMLTSVTSLKVRKNCRAFRIRFRGRFGTAAQEAEKNL